jgi:hypothetical protein
MAFIKQTMPDVVSEDERFQQRDYSGLLLQLNDADPTVRRWAAHDLVAFPESSAALVVQLQTEKEISVREVILTSLTRIGDATAVSGLIECLRSEAAPVRNGAIEAMKALQEKVAPVVDGLLHDADPDVRIMAVNILESLCHPMVEQWLIEVIDHDPQVNVCAAAVDLLGEVGSPAAHDALARLERRFSEEPYIKFAADLALKRTTKA